MRARSALSFFGLCLALGCSNTPAANDTGTGGGNDAGSDAATAPGDDAGTDAATVADTGTTDDTGTDAAASGSDSGCDGVLLTVHNILAWCSVSVNGGATSTGATQTVCVPANTDINLVATAASSAFILGNWHNTDGDTAGTGDPGTVAGGMSTATYMTSASGTACVWVCCPFTSGTGCTVADPCL